MLTDQQNNDISISKKISNNTKRVVSPMLEEILYDAIPCLDWGFVRCIDYMGDDDAIVQSARVSYGKGTKKVNEDAGLINYLMRNNHMSPFEMCEIKFHLKMPIFVMRQWIRHRTANVNEYSARYSIMNKEFYLPDAKNLAPQSNSNHQGRDGNTLSPDESARVLELLKRDAEQCHNTYVELMNVDENGNKINGDYDGLARELARMNLNLNYYTECYWKIDLRNLLHFVGLRADSHAQYEIRVYAEVIMDIINKWCPLAYKAFKEYRINSLTLSNKEVKKLRSYFKSFLINDSNKKPDEFSKGEWNDFINKLEKI